MKTSRIVILDFGSQYTRLIAKRIRALGVFADILPYDTQYDTLKAAGDVKGVILSGGPQSVHAEDAYRADTGLFNSDLPILGICYGMQLIAHHHGGVTVSGAKREYGLSTLKLNADALFADLKGDCAVWMSHGDHIETLPSKFVVLAETPTGIIAGFKHLRKPHYGLQFHPEVRHTLSGDKILENFVYGLCGAEANWTTENIIESQVSRIRETVGEDRVLLGLSGGVDSSVAAVIIDRAIGNQLTCVFVDNGLLRKGEAEEVMKTFTESFTINLIKVDAKDRFINNLKGVFDPEQKRRIIGKTFIDVFQETTEKLGHFTYLAQGTLYTDIIESGTAAAKTIKSHHNVGGLPKTMRFKLLEPLNELFKDEVRIVGEALDMPHHIVHRQPFPGPGLAIRIIGEVTEEKLALVRDSDAILHEEIKHHHLENTLWQYFTVLTPLKTVGVMGDIRTYEHTLAIRAVTSTDGMTADWAKIPWPALESVSRRIVNEITGINRVVYDITSKPPATIEWE